MQKLIVVAALGMIFVGVGCKDHKMPWDKKATTQDSMQMDAMKDDCQYCPGVQHADANGYCPKCHSKVKG